MKLRAYFAMRQTNLPRTPLQKIVGFNISEEIYDQLPLVSQTIIDLKIEGYTYHEIADVLDLPYTTVYDMFMRSRYHLAKLKLVLETRQYYKETHTLVPESHGDN